MSIETLQRPPRLAHAATETGDDRLPSIKEVNRGWAAWLARNPKGEIRMSTRPTVLRRTRRARA